MNIITRLREQEKTLVSELESKIKAKEALLLEQKDINRELDSMYEKLRALDAERMSLAKKMDVNNEKIEMLAYNLKTYKDSLKERERVLLMEEYRRALAEISKIDFSLGPKIFGCFQALRSMESARFGNMRRKIREKYEAERNVLKQRLEDGVSSHIRAECGLHKAFLYLNYMKKYDAFFGEDIFDAYFFRDMVDNFTYHFLSGKDTNRLDKPEWMFKFLYEKCEEYSKFFEIFAKPFGGFLKKLEEVVNIKVRELGGCSSGQKRSLVWHFADEFIAFSRRIFERYGHAVSSTEVCDMLMENEHMYVDDALLKVYSMEYSRWFGEYRSLVGGSLYFYRRYMCLDWRMLDVFVRLVDRISESCSIFIDQMRFISKEEIRVLCYFYSEMEGLKGFVNEEEADLFLNCDDEAVVNMIQQANAKIVRFNQHSLGLLKLLAENDVQKLLRNVKSFSYTQERDLVSFTIDLTQMLQNYKSCISYLVLLSHVQKKVDRFLVDQVILKDKLSSEHYLRFIDFFEHVKDVFGSTGAWETSAYIRCVECIFNGQEYHENPSLFKTVSELYSNN
eukprot:jgi/Antlo1/2149/875